MAEDKTNTYAQAPPLEESLYVQCDEKCKGWYGNTTVNIH